MSDPPILPVGGDGWAASGSGRGPAATQAVVVVDRRDGVVHVAVTGELDLSNAKTVEQQIVRCLGGEPTALTLDITGLDYIDSAGLWILFRLGARLTAAGIAGEVLVPADGPVRRMVETAGVAAAIRVRPCDP